MIEKQAVEEKPRRTTGSLGFESGAEIHLERAKEISEDLKQRLEDWARGKMPDKELAFAGLWWLNELIDHLRILGVAGIVSGRDDRLKDREARLKAREERLEVKETRLGTRKEKP